MPKTVQIRDIDDDVYRRLAQRAAEQNMSVPELLRREATKLADRPTISEWLARTRRRPSKVSVDQTLEALEEIRGPWPDADR